MSTQNKHFGINEVLKICVHFTLLTSIERPSPSIFVLLEIYRLLTIEANSS